MSSFLLTISQGLAIAVLFSIAGVSISGSLVAGMLVVQLGDMLFNRN